MKILYISPEVVPFAKTGGLADVAGALPIALKEIGHDIRIFMPRYKSIDPQKYNLETVIQDLKIKIGEREYHIDILEGKIPNTSVVVYFLEHEGYFGSRNGLYQDHGKDYEDNCERFSLFCRAALEILPKIDFQPNIIHVNDWQSALTLAYLKIDYAENPFYQNIASVYSIHNMAYLGTCDKSKMPIIGLGWENFTMEKLEFHDQVCSSKAGMVYADIINTVSEQYAREIQTPEFGCGLEGLLKKRKNEVYGVINGIDNDIWDPAKDIHIAKRYNLNTISMKFHNKLALQSLLNLPEKKDMPVLAIVSRLATQKGFDILTEAMKELMQENLQFVLLGTGDPIYHKILGDFKDKYPNKIALRFIFDENLAHLIYSGADLFILPSKYEPCGLGQLISFKYGTIPVVRKTGGLADTVKDYNSHTGEGDGFVFEEYTQQALYGAVKRGLELFSDQLRFKMLMSKVMKYDYSWLNSAKKYVALYKKALTHSARK